MSLKPIIDLSVHKNFLQSTKYIDFGREKWIDLLEGFFLVLSASALVAQVEVLVKIDHGRLIEVKITVRRKNLGL